MSELSEQLTTDSFEPVVKTEPSNQLPPKSKQHYISVYKKFIAWQKDKKTTSFSENVLLAYFTERSKTYKASSLWAQYSMLKTTLLTYNNIHIKYYAKLIEFLKKQSVGFQSKKTKVLTRDQVGKYLDEAPDQKYLATKVALIFGITGACRRDELSLIKIKDVREYESSMYLVKVPVTKTHMSRTFTITDKFHEIVKKYHSLRPPNCKCDRFFLNYQSGKCTQQPIGINKFGSMPKAIASYLNLKDPESYTGHSIRRTSASLLAEAGVEINTLKRHSKESNLVAEGDVDQSLSNEPDNCDQIGQSITIKEEGDIETLLDCKKEIHSHLDIIEELPERFFENTETTGDISCESGSQNISSTITEQHFDLTTKINFPRKNIHLTINNCSNVSFHFHGR